jgi:hypothetical protein
MNYQDFIPGAIGAAGYYKQREDFNQLGKDINQDLDNIRGGIQDNTQFQPWSVTNGMGSTQGTRNGITSNLNPQMQSISDQMFGGGMDAINSSMGDRAGREQQIYDRARAMQLPGEERQRQMLGNNERAAGRSGMFTNQFGGTPQQHAQAMAQQEAMNTASFNAMGQAESEAQGLFNRGQGMMGMGYDPYNQQRMDMGMGLNNAKMGQYGDLQSQKMLTDLGLGQINTQTNLAGIEAGMFGDFIKTLQQGGRAGGQYLDDNGGISGVAGGLWDRFGVGGTQWE